MIPYQSSLPEAGEEEREPRDRARPPCRKGLLAHIAAARAERLQAEARAPAKPADGKRAAPPSLEDRKAIEAAIITAAIVVATCYVTGVSRAELAALTSGEKVFLGGFVLLIFWLYWRIRFWNARRKIERDRRRRVFELMEAELLRKDQRL